MKQIQKSVNIDGYKWINKMFFMATIITSVTGW